MTTKTKKKITSNTKIIKRKIASKPMANTSLDLGESKNIAVGEIDFSPLNYRKYYSQTALEDFATELSMHGIICPVTVRRMPNGRYELVAGERRLRAATIAALKQVPAMIKSLTDDEVIEIQLAENLQRENPHPMHEAQAIGQMQRSGKTIDEIASRLGKSKQFVYIRLKLLSLIEAFQEMIFADALSLQNALQIATLSEASQLEFYVEHCSKWKKDKNFRLHILEYYLNQYRYDLKKAPFNIKDKKLMPEVGACTGCPSNSATLKTLFPDYAKQAVCSNKECYNKKCTLHFLSVLESAISTYQPAALIFNNQTTEMAENIIALIPGAAVLPRHNFHDITVIQKPEIPDKEDYTDDYDEDNPEFDEDAYKEATENYYSELEVYNLNLKSGHYQIAVLLDNKEFIPVYFCLEKSKQYNTGTAGITAKEVQAAIKAGNATPELLQAEINRLNEREKRAKDLDREKKQLILHNTFSEQIAKPEKKAGLTDADLISIRLIVYQSLDYSTRCKVDEVLFTDKADDKQNEHQHFYQLLAGLSDSQFAWLIRVAIVAKSESKYISSVTAYFLYRLAQSAGVHVHSIEEAQKQKAEERQEKVLERISTLEKKIEKLETSKSSQ